MAVEANFDGLVGPTHNYAGLSRGNVASQANRRRPANPRQAALQGLEKMRRVAEWGVAQAVIPPLPRPHVAWLRSLGFSGTDPAVLEKAGRGEPALLAAAWSASSMWTANAATVSPSCDSADGKVHITPANLSSQIHRSLEPQQTAALLRHVFPGPAFVHHAALPSGPFFGDEGAANHMRLAPEQGATGVQVFVDGRSALRPDGGPRKYPARQSREAGEAVARLHALDAERAVFLRQNPAAIDAGVFHNDVIAVANENLLFCHEAAFQDRAAALGELRRKLAAAGGKLRLAEATAKDISLKEAVATYLFNSQILTLPGGGMRVLAARECGESRRARACLERLVGRGHVRDVEYADLRQSMRNGGGPACLRLRVVLTPEEWAAVPAALKFDAALHARLKAWVERHYRDRLLPKDLADPALLREAGAAFAELAELLRLPREYAA